MTLTFACGHHVTTEKAGAVACPCGERRIRDVQAPAPTFRGWCSGPLATFAALDPVPISLKSETTE